ncbi:hypothetical protein COCC4DRAFT_150854 [Bipolaris maydis ATCC 48331]|uniref:SWIM-type domain-containing protein n=2 Tax=Cochliobolus heterostrophus TaxID=5016 RepID=M2TZJ9_COCH5|nr:uncharacterized protein COCC4DRAFT_150854 [Bipolaris maydis ATCC 48331]EMD87261.1 hypothetical protein COCHEDRAFT_1184086 [Bipolaris maydis C5]KAH7555081.1 hypothetical protein BM1_07742 [Bipolaris maydis]ENI00344.1 hypothetical protein COCC4DRAFT_150854 [Bipolaris maydis ATCC 48331]KAJ5023011.1 hypothetical protein J3E73DRAFT_384427 [Bipolaris maydis]KAJ5056244.1 hypothetical protein J3E74DRAFT_280628 [Bipolaris maydis]
MSLPKLPTNRRFLTRLFNSLAPPPAPSSPDAAASLTDDDKHHPNPLDSVPPAVKKQLLSLQVLFPTEFIPALDVLDRRLVTRFRIRNHPSSPSVHRQDGVHHQDAVMRLGGDDDHDNDDDDDEEMHMSDDATLKDATRTLSTKHTSLPHEEATSIPVHVTTTTSTYDKTTKSTIYYVQSAQHHRSSRYSSSSDQTPTYQVRLTTWSCSCPAFTFAAFPASPDSSSIPFANHANDNHDDNDTAQDHPWIFGGTTLGDDMPPVCKHLLACLLAEKSNSLFGRFVNEKWVTVHEAAGWAAGWGD